MQTVRIALAGVARAEGRIGKQMIAQMLRGSRAKIVKNLGFDKLSTFGLLKHLRQSDIQSLLDALLKTGLVEQEDVERYRPVLKLTELGRQVMMQQAELTGDLPLSRDVLDSINEHDFSATDDGEAAGDKVATAPAPTHRRIDPPAASSKPSYYWTWRLLSAGFKVEECAEIRRLSRDDILRDAAAAVQARLKLDVAWVLSRDDLTALAAAWQAGALSSDADPPGGFCQAQVDLFLKCRAVGGVKKQSQTT